MQWVLFSAAGRKLVCLKVSILHDIDYTNIVIFHIVYKGDYKYRHITRSCYIWFGVES